MKPLSKITIPLIGAVIAGSIPYWIVYFVYGSLLTSEVPSVIMQLASLWCMALALYCWAMTTAYIEIKEKTNA